MAAAHTGTYVTVTFDWLENLVKSTKAPSSARNYLAMVRRLREFAGGDSLSLDAVNPGFVAGFGDHLLSQGLSPSSVALFKKCFRALFKDLFGTERRLQFKEAFAEVDSCNVTASSAMTLGDLKKISEATLVNHMPLSKIRDMFMYCVYGGGLTPWSLGKRNPEVAQQSVIAARFAKAYGRTIDDYASSLDDGHYSSGLLALSNYLGLKFQLATASALDAWITAARNEGLPPALIAATAKGENPFTRQASSPGIVFSEEQKNDAMRRVADSLYDVSPHWFVMRCFESSPTETAGYLATAVGKTYPGEFFETFIAPGRGLKRGKTGADPARSLMDSMLFFHSSTDIARYVKTVSSPGAYLFSSRATGLPLQIPESDMKIFMLLADVSGDTIDYHFPLEEESLPEFTTGVTARIVAGDFTGNVGVVSKLSSNRYRVMVTFPALNGARVTADIPIAFLRFPQTEPKS